LNHQDNITDEDNDTLLNYEECTYQTSPTDPDYDDDRLLDGEEVHEYSTDPNNSDTDYDGYSDYEEIQRGTNPLNEYNNPLTRLFGLITFYLILGIGIIIGIIIGAGYIKKTIKARSAKRRRISNLENLKNHMGDCENFIDARQFKKAFASADKAQEFASELESEDQIGFQILIEQVLKLKSLVNGELLGIFKDKFEDRPDLKKVFINFQLGDLYLSRDNYTITEEYYLKALKLAKASENNTILLKALKKVFLILQKRGKLELAQKHRHSIKRIKVEIAYNEKMELGKKSFQKKDFFISKEYYKKALELAEKIDNKEFIWDARYQLGLVFYTQKEFEDAKRQLEYLKPIKEKINDEDRLFNLIELRGKIIFMTKPITETIDYFSDNFRDSINPNYKLSLKRYMDLSIALFQIENPQTNGFRDKIQALYNKMYNLVNQTGDNQLIEVIELKYNLRKNNQ
jgi:tetratricopeptide (TPR) repeat protein